MSCSLLLALFSSCRSQTDQQTELQTSVRASSARTILLSSSQVGLPDEIGNALEGHLRPWLYRLSDEQVLALIDASSRDQFGTELLSVAESEVEVLYAALVVAIESGNAQLASNTSKLLAESLGLDLVRPENDSHPDAEPVTLEDAWRLAEQKFGVRSFYSRPVYVSGIGPYSGKYVYHLPFELWNGLSTRRRAELVDHVARVQPGNWEFVLGRVMDGDVMYDKVIVEKRSHSWNAEYGEWSW